MPKKSAPPDLRPLIWGIYAILALTAYRVFMLTLHEADLFVDETQYWFWSRELAFGYYSKPPLIAWVIRAFTEIGSNAPFWLRLPLPLFHGATALVLLGLGHRLFGPRAGALVGVAWVTLPAVALGSVQMSTDTLLMLFYALSLWGLTVLTERRSLLVAVLTGIAVGLGLLAKYAMIYFALTALLAALLPVGRIARRDALAMAVTAVAVFSPNVIWNLTNGLTTVRHTADNANWNGVQLNWNELLEFLAGQFGVFGPVFFAVFVFLAVRGVLLRLTAQQGRLLLLSLPILLMVCGQALMSRAYANWAAATYIAGILLVVPWMATHLPRWLTGSLVLHGALALALPWFYAFPADLRRPDGELFLKRLIGRDELSLEIAQTARDAGLKTIVAADRDILADLFYTLHDQDYKLYARPARGFAPHHYALKHPAPDDLPGEVMIVQTGNDAPDCAATLLSRWQPPEVTYFRKPLSFWRGDAACWAP